MPWSSVPTWTYSNNQNSESPQRPKWEFRLAVQMNILPLTELQSQSPSAKTTLGCSSADQEQLPMLLLLSDIAQP